MKITEIQAKVMMEEGVDNYDDQQQGYRYITDKTDYSLNGLPEPVTNTALTPPLTSPRLIARSPERIGPKWTTLRTTATGTTRIRTQ